MHKNDTKCNETLSKWCKNKHGASKIIDTFETYQFGTPFSGITGSQNGINVLQQSPVFARLAEGNPPLVHYKIKSHPYNKYYYLANGIYPEWSTFMKTIHEPTKEKHRRFAKRQESIQEGCRECILCAPI
jgi:hypothetical protein